MSTIGIMRSVSGARTPSVPSTSTARPGYSWAMISAAVTPGVIICQSSIGRPAARRRSAYTAGGSVLPLVNST